MTYENEILLAKTYNAITDSSVAEVTALPSAEDSSDRNVHAAYRVYESLTGCIDVPFPHETQKELLSNNDIAENIDMLHDRVLNLQSESVGLLKRILKEEVSHHGPADNG